MEAHLELYRVFVQVAKAGSISSAASALFLTQPAVSQSIARLEEALSVRLFTRSARGVALTGEGEVLLHYAEAALSLLSAGEQKLDRLRRLLDGELRVGAGDTVTRHFLLPHIRAFHERHPGITLRMTNRTSPELLNLLRRGELDLALFNQPDAPPEGVSVTPCLTLEDTFVAGPPFAHLRGRALSGAELSELPLLMLEPASSSRQYVDRCFLSQGISLSPEIELTSFDLLLDFAAIGLGAACVVRELFDEEELTNRGLFPLTLASPLPRRHLALGRLSSMEPSPAAAAFCRMIAPDGSA